MYDMLSLVKYCHSERSEESLFLKAEGSFPSERMFVRAGTTPHSVQDDNDKLVYKIFIE
jgi:hypothetical protein